MLIKIKLIIPFKINCHKLKISKISMYKNNINKSQQLKENINNIQKKEYEFIIFSTKFSHLIFFCYPNNGMMQHRIYDTSNCKQSSYYRTNLNQKLENPLSFL